MPMTKTLQLIDRNTYLFLYQDHGANALQLVWTPETRDMSDDDFLGALELLASEAEKRKCPHVLVDARCFAASVSDAGMEARSERIVPRYNAVLKKFAFLVRAAPKSSEPRQGDGETFWSRTSDSEQALLDWFGEG